MKSKIFNITIISLVISVILTVVFVNYYIDPLDVFHTKNRLNYIKPCLTKNQRISLIPSLKLNKNKIDAVWIGNSRTGWSVNEVYDSKITGKNFLNMAVNASTFNEALNMAYNVILIHPEIKEIYFGIDFSSLKKTYDTPEQLLKRENLSKVTSKEILPLLLSGKVFIYSFNTITANLKINNEQKKQLEELYKYYGTERQHNDDMLNVFKSNIETFYKEDYKNYETDREKLKELKELINFGNQQGIKIIFFTTGMHVAERIMIEQSGKLKDFYEVKKELANIQPYYDFTLINKYTTEEINPDMQSFRDLIHPYPFLRKKISNQLFSGNEDFGVLITKNNVDLIMKSDDLKYKKYINKNKNLVEMVKEHSK